MSVRLVSQGESNEDSSNSETETVSLDEEAQDVVPSLHDDPRRADSSKIKADAHLKSFTRPRAWMILLGVALAACAGMVDVIAVRELGSFVSHATGTTARIGERLEGVRTGDVEQFDLAHAFLGVFSFMFGAFLCGLIVPRNQMHFGGKQFYGIALMGNSLLLILVTFISPHYSAVYLAAMACGLQNAMCTMHLGAIIRTTHVTGTVTDIGSGIGRVIMLLIQRQCRRSRLRAFDRAEIQVDVQKIVIWCSLWVGFLMGAFLGAFMHATLEWQEWSFLVPASITGSLSILYMCFGRHLKKAFQAYEARQLQRDLDQVVQALGRTRNQLETFASERNSAENWAAQSDLVNELEDDVDEIMAVIHDVEETLHDRSDERQHTASSGQSKGGSRRANKSSRRSNA